MNDLIFGGASTFSKMHCNYPENYPSVVRGSEDNDVVGISGNHYFDTVSALGARLIDNYGNGGILSLPHVDEDILARMLQKYLPFIEMVRYGCNGADATEGALRYARAFTGHPLVYSVGYHSCQSAFTFNTQPALGCINGLIQPFNSFESLIKSLTLLDEDHTVAAVIIEPVMLDLDVKDQLKEIRRLTTENGIVLIFDEIITGFRVPKRSISAWFDITPDLILLGKAMGGGYPLSIIGGPAAIMNVPVFHSYTFAALPEALRNALHICGLPGAAFDLFWCLAGEFMETFNSRSNTIKLDGYATRGVWTGPDELKYIFWQEMLRRGILVGVAFFPKIGWSKEDYDLLLKISLETLDDIEKNNVKLCGRTPEPIFKRNSR